MESTHASQGKPNWLLSVSLRRPGTVMFILFVLAVVFKILDVFVLRLDERLGEAILTKSLGFMLVVVYVWACKRQLRDIGFKARNVGKALLISAVCFVSLYVVAHTVQIIALRASGEEAGIAFSAVDFTTGKSGGQFFGMFLVLANFVNSAMEEGLFRGTMLRHFRLKYSFWGAILLGAGYFSIWHITGPIRQVVDGQAGLGEASFQAFGLMLATFFAALVWGYMYLKTDNLWAPFLAHTINNSVFNVLFIRTSEGVQSGLEYGLFLVIFLLGHLALIPVIGWAARRLDMPEVQPWS